MIELTSLSSSLCQGVTGVFDRCGLLTLLITAVWLCAQGWLMF